MNATSIVEADHVYQLHVTLTNVNALPSMVVSVLVSGVFPNQAQ